MTSRPMIVAALLCIAPACVQAQAAPPGTDIYLVPLQMSASEIMLGAPVNITHRAGYDNQPSFTPDSRAVLFTSVREDAQADIYRYDISAGTTTRLTKTAESEYSATVMPGGKRFSVIRVEADSTQRLWSFDTRGENPELVLQDIQPVGYHAWADDHTLALFVLGSPNTLQVADTRSGESQVVAFDIGRSLVPVPGGRDISFLQHADGGWVLTKLELSAPAGTPLSAAPIAWMPPRADYVAWTNDGRAITATGTRVMAWGVEQQEWSEVTDLADAGLTRISRLAISADGKWLALVAEPRR